MATGSDRMWQGIAPQSLRARFRQKFRSRSAEPAVASPVFKSLVAISQSLQIARHGSSALLTDLVELTAMPQTHQNEVNLLSEAGITPEGHWLASR